MTPLPDTLLAGLVALISSFSFGVSGVLSKRGLIHIEPLAGTLITVGAAVAAFAATSPLWMRADEWFTAGFWVFAALGIIQPTLSMYLANEAYSRAGATVVSTFAATAPLFAAALAVGFLGERLTLAIAAGTVLTVLGLAALSWMPGGAGRIVALALVFATCTAAIRGLNHVVAKFGIELLPNVFMAGLCSFSVSFLSLAAVYRWRNGEWRPRGLPRTGVRYFAACGVCVACGTGALFGALSLGPVVVVSPIVATYPIFTLFAAALVRDERITGKVLAGVALVVAGVALLSSSARGGG